MEQDVNLIIEQYKEGLFNITNQSNLPIGIIRLVVNDFNTFVEENYQQYMKQARERAAAAAQQTAQEPEVVEEPVVEDETV